MFFEGKISVLFSDYELTGPCVDFCWDNRGESKVGSSQTVFMHISEQKLS